MAESGRSRKIGDRLSEAARGSFFGRREELAFLSDVIQSPEPSFVVAFIHGPGGIGKTRLIHASLGSVRSDVRRCVMDCRHIEPTPQGLLSALGIALGMQTEPSHGSVSDCLEGAGDRTVLVLDTYETFGLMDTWLRQVFVPSLSENVFTIIAGRQAPHPAWSTAPGWQDLFREIELHRLSADESQRMLESRGLSPSQAERVNRFARGYPLVLEMASAAVRTQPDLEIIEAPPPKVLEQLTHVFLSGLPREIMEAVEASSTIRRVTEPQLRAVLNTSQVAEIFDELEKLPFVDMTTEGLSFHDVVRDTTSKGLAWRDPERYRTYRRRAWRFFSRESHECVTGNLWQCTADLLYLIENPVVKEAFFPEGVSDFIVEPATGIEGGDIHEITAATELEEASQWIARWWDNHPEIFCVAKSRAGRPEGFYFIFEPDKVDQPLLADDPITALWSRHLSENPIADGERALFLRRWLARTTGEAPSSVQGACWLDIKRTYMECRPGLRRLYTAVKDLATYAPIVVPLGFAPMEGASVSMDGVDYHSAVLDFGPSSVDGWIARLVGAELGIDAPEAEEALTEGGRLLVTVLFTDIVESTEKAAELGDRRWRDLLERHNTVVRGELAKFQGREIDTAGDSFLCIFDSPASAIRCACSICESVDQLGMQIRAGLHLGECEAVKGGVRGIAVHIGARVARIAGPGEILVSSTVRDAMAGSAIRFSDSGSHVLKGIKGKWRVFAVERT